MIVLRLAPPLLGSCLALFLSTAAMIVGCDRLWLGLGAR